MGISLYKHAIVLGSTLAHQAGILVAIVWVLVKLYPEGYLARWGLGLATVMAVFLGTSIWLRALRPDRVLHPIRTVVALLAPLTLALVSGAVVSALTTGRGLPEPRTLVAAFAASVGAVTLVQVLISIGMLAVLGVDKKTGFNVLVVGNNSRSGEAVRRWVETAVVPINIVGYLDRNGGMTSPSPDRDRSWPSLGTIENLRQTLLSTPVDEVWVTLPLRSCYDDIQQTILLCETIGTPLRMSPEIFHHNVSMVRSPTGRWADDICFLACPLKSWKILVKRVMDLAIGITALSLAAPLMGLIAVAVKLTSKGPVFFRQTRCGLHGREFTLYKFRSMVQGAEYRKPTLIHLNEVDGPIFKMKNDPRITPVGKLLRKLSLDELPQLWNVVRGDMSIVGPRPPVPDEVAKYELWQRRRLCIRPGLTCTWQVSGRSKISFEEWMQMDLEYVANWTLAKDFRLMLETIPAVLMMRGAL